MTCPEGFESLEAVVSAAKPNATVTMPAAWIRELLVYVRKLEAVHSAERSCADGHLSWIAQANALTDKADPCRSKTQ